MKTEKETRQDIIDKKLFQVGWNVNDRTQGIEEFEIEVEPRNETREPPSPYHNLQFSDYVLLGKDAKPLAVVENIYRLLKKAVRPALLFCKGYCSVPLRPSKNCAACLLNDLKVLLALLSKAFKISSASIKMF